MLALRSSLKFARRGSQLLTLAATVAMGASGCGLHQGLSPIETGQSLQLLDNPLFVGVTDRDLLWNQLVDSIDTYFDIEREEQVKLAGEILTEGRIETVPRAAATLLEPWHLDSTSRFDAWQATLQSIRLSALVRVLPVDAGYRIEVVVQKELEDVDRPEGGTAGGSAMRHDGSIRGDQDPTANGSTTLGWIPLGRDIALEQRILADIQSRLSAGPGPLDRF
ncbi:MAG: hypothetical protein CMJ75_13795 [Planctomycetaceae bacterium]|nr:hypothetical protein [Planctomycetaceae bacterium]